MPYNSFLNYPMSWKPDRARLERPVYKSLAKALEEDIANGLLAPGVKLPPQRELADFLDINFTTVTRAYRACELKGLIYAVTGSGTFVSPSAAEPVTITSSRIKKETIDMGFVSSFESTNALAAEAVKKLSSSSHIQDLLDYESPTGLPHQKRAAVRWLSHVGYRAEEELLAIVPGTQDGLLLTLLALFEPGDRIAVDTFTYANFLELLRLLHLQPVPVRGDGEGMRPDALEETWKLNPVKGVFLMPSCSNPTTVMMSSRRKKDLAAVISRRGIILIEDDIHAFFTEGLVEDYQGPLSSLVPDSHVYLSGTSKPLCSGLRVAYLGFSEKFRARILEALFNVNVKTSSLDAEIITMLLTSGLAGRILEEKTELARKANGLFSSIFPQSPAGHPLSFYRWLRIKTSRTGTETEEHLLSKGIRVYHSDRFLAGSRGEHCYLRLSLSTSQRLEEGLMILSGCLSELK